MKLPTIAIDARLVAGTNTGDSTYWTGLIHGLTQIKPEAKFLLIANKPKPESIPENSNFVWVPLPSRSSRWWSLVKFPITARKMGASTIHTQYSLSPLVGKFGVTTIHDVSFFIGPEWFSFKDRTILRRSVPAAVKRARSIIAVSQTDKAEIERFIPEARGKTSVTYNACPPWVRRQEVEMARAQVHHRFDFSEPYLLTVGTRWPRKNMELAVEAARNLDPKLPHRLVITGHGSWDANSLGSRALLTGYVTNDDLSLLYSGATLYLATSRHEGFGIPLLEAFRCGCPVLCSEGGALPEIAGQAAVVESSWEALDWTKRIESLIGDSSKLRLLTQRGYEREAEFSWPKIAQRTLDVYLQRDGD